MQHSRTLFGRRSIEDTMACGKRGGDVSEAAMESLIKTSWEDGSDVRYAKHSGLGNQVIP